MSYLYKIYDAINIHDGKVGIGTTDPSELLHVEGSVYFDRVTNRTSNLDFAYCTLNNINTINATSFNVTNFNGTTVTTDILSTATSGGIINATDKTLSNVNTISVARITSDADNLNVSTKSLSNVTSVSIVNLTSDNLNINVSTRSLSNVSIVSMEKMTAEGLNINVSTKSLSNVTTASLVNLTSDNSNINVSTRSLSNVTTVSVENVTAEGLNINVSTKSLSNVTAVSLAKLTSDGSNINVSARSLSNVSVVSMEKMTAEGLNINVSTRSLSNVTNLSVVNITSDASSIHFNDKTLDTIDSIVVRQNGTFGGTITASNLQIIGDFTTLNTTTSNTEQMVITNLGTGPALKVIQTGVGDEFSIAEFYDNESGIALKVADTGRVGINTASPTSRVHAYDASSMEMKLQTTSTNPSRITMLNGDGDATLGLQNGNFDLISTTTYPMRLGTNSTENIRIQSNGNIGIGTNAPNYKLEVAGGSVAVSDVFYIKQGGMNVIHWCVGNVTYSTTGAQTLGARLQWATTQSDNKYAFRVCARFHVASGSEVAYRKFETLITPVNDNATGKPCQIVATEIADTTNTHFVNLSHNATRHGNNTVSLYVSWDSTAQPAIGNIQLEVFANQALGDFTFTKIPV